MSKKQKIEIDPDDIHAAQTEALAEEVLRLQNEVDAEKESRRALQAQMEALRQTVTQVSNSVDIDPPAPAPLERPTVTVGANTLRFKSGAFILRGKRILAADVAANETMLLEIVEKYPGLFERIGD